MDQERLICAITDDDHASDVLETGKAIGAATGLELQYVTVAEVDTPASPAVVPAGAGTAWAPFPEGSFHTAERRAAERAAEFFTSMGLDEPSTRVRTGSTAAELDEVARSSGAAAIVLGASPGSAVTSLGIGSVARWLAVNGSTPVIFARGSAALDMAGPVVCGVDVDSDAADQVARVAARFATLLDRELARVHVGDGDEAEALAAEAEARNASLLVVGNRGRGPVRSMLAGSVSLELARNARPPVVVVPPEAATGGERPGAGDGRDDPS